MSSLAVSAIVMMATESGEMSTVAEVDIMLYEMSKSGHRDQTWREFVDALLDVRTLVGVAPVALADSVPVSG